MRFSPINIGGAPSNKPPEWIKYYTKKCNQFSKYSSKFF